MSLLHLAGVVERAKYQLDAARFLVPASQTGGILFDGSGCQPFLQPPLSFSELVCRMQGMTSVGYPFRRAVPKGACSLTYVVLPAKELAILVTLRLP